MTIEEIVELTKRMERETKAIKDELYRLCWYMRGSLSFSEVYELSPEDRELVSKIVSDNFETTKKSGLPFF